MDQSHENRVAITELKNYISWIQVNYGRELTERDREWLYRAFDIGLEVGFIELIRKLSKASLWSIVSWRLGFGELFND